MPEQLGFSFDTPLNEVDLKRQEILGPEWFYVLRDVLNSPKVRKVSEFVGQRRQSMTAVVYPKREDTFRAFKLTPFNEVKLVILGQDPYHNG